MTPFIFIMLSISGNTFSKTIQIEMKTNNLIIKVVLHIQIVKKKVNGKIDIISDHLS
jgi:hypothetical protein